MSPSVLIHQKTDTAGLLSEHTLLVGFIEPFARHDLVQQLAEQKVTTLPLEFVPRTTRAQSYDALSSQASLAGYVAVLLAANSTAKVLPMMSTAAGTIQPARVLVIGTGVAGLQAIATARRLGARVTAFDVRDTAKEQVESLGAKFAVIDLGQTEEQAGGYAGALTDEQLAKQRAGLAALCAESDIIVTTAQIFGRPAPTILTPEMVAGMKRGAVIVDTAFATGGNVDSSVELDEDSTTNNGVLILREARLAARVAVDASAVLGKNITGLLGHVCDDETLAFRAGRPRRRRHRPDARDPRGRGHPPAAAERDGPA